MPITGFTFTFLQAKVHRHTLKKRNSLSYLHEVAARFKRAATFVLGPPGKGGTRCRAGRAAVRAEKTPESEPGRVKKSK